MNVHLVLRKENGDRKSFPLPNSVTVLGRQQECDLCVPLMVVSRRHCQINLDDGKLRIRDLGSRNGTYLNGQRIEEAVLDTGDEIRIGPLIFTVQVGPQAEEKPGKAGSGGDLTYGRKTEVPKEFTGLDDLGDLDDLDDLDDLIEVDEDLTMDEADAMSESSIDREEGRS